MLTSVEGEVKEAAAVAATGVEIFNAAILSSMEFEVPTVSKSLGDGVFFAFSPNIDIADLSDSKLFDRSLLGVLVADSEPVEEVVIIDADADTDTADDDEDIDADTAAGDAKDDEVGADFSEDAFKAANFSAMLLVLFGLDVAVFEVRTGGDGVDFSRAILSFTDKGVGDASDIFIPRF